jgi:molybdate transport system ATP-binding protein
MDLKSMDIALSVQFKKAFPGGFSMEVSWKAGREIVVLFGPSGAGKSLTFQSIAGLVTPNEGLIRLGDKVLYDARAGIDLPPQSRDIGYLFQHYALFPHMTTRENVLYGHRQPRSSEAAADFAAMLTRFHLEGLEQRYPGALSGGQRQRVALARALMRKPKVLLLDEPLSAVDLSVRRSIRSELKNLQRALDIPMVIITHDLGEALALADRLVIYDHGRVLQSGTPEAIVQDPQNEIIAAWAGNTRLHGERTFSF